MKLLFVCAGGMSSSLTASKLENVFKENNEDITVEAYGAVPYGESSYKLALEREKFELVLVAPQIKYKLREIEKVCKDFDVPVMAFPMKLYAPTEGNLKELYKLIKTLI
jgi:PTS system cellobiose-specific IIB component